MLFAANLLEQDLCVEWQRLSRLPSGLFAWPRTSHPKLASGGPGPLWPFSHFYHQFTSTKALLCVHPIDSDKHESLLMCYVRTQENACIIAFPCQPLVIPEPPRRQT
ncbi:hypothetical protein FJTKL_06267 [Diaporthe vaccinii]|uniref:Uncharacterized protein n=1 Tax=Diaporthe vaccinii TaxID=105482 RepID=A0ABR4DRA7_9PEZI